MAFTLTDEQRTALEAAMTAAPRVRRWKRYRAIVLRGDGLSVPAVAQSLGCSQASAYAWSAAWRRDGVAGLAEGDHGGGQVKLGPTAEALLTELLATDPQTQGHRATGWTVPSCAPNWPRGGRASANAPSAVPCIGSGIAGNARATSWVVRTRTLRQKRGRNRPSQRHARRGG